MQLNGKEDNETTRWFQIIFKKFYSPFPRGLSKILERWVHFYKEVNSGYKFDG